MDGTTRKITIITGIVVLVAGFFVYHNMVLTTNNISPDEKTLANTTKITSTDKVALTQPITTPKITTPEKIQILDQLFLNEIHAQFRYTSQPNLPQLQKVALNDINNYRLSFHLSPLTLGTAKSPQLYAQELAQEGCIHHIDSKGQGPMLRYKTNGDTMFLVGENIAISHGFKDLPSEQSFILNEDLEMMFNDASENWNHKKNILDANYSSVSIGVAYYSGTLVMVQDFQKVLQAGYEYDPRSFQTEPMDYKECL